MARSGLILYGLVKATEESSLGPIGLEYQGEKPEVRVIVVDGVGAIVSDYAAVSEILPTRRNLDAYNRVIREAAAKHTVIPLSFGHLVKSSANVTRMLKVNRRKILSEIARLDNKVEISLRVRWDVENIFDYFMQADPELRAARDRTFRGGGSPTHTQKLELGQLFEDHLSRERQSHTERVVDELRGCSAEVKVNPPGTEKTVMDLALLVDRLAMQELEKKVYEVAERFPSQFTFDYNGPWAPYNFVEVELEMKGRA